MRPDGTTRTRKSSSLPVLLSGLSSPTLPLPHSHTPVFQKLAYNVALAVDGIVQNKVRAMLTSLGIIFGVASVIAMLAIGSGAEQEILRQIRVLGGQQRDRASGRGADGRTG